MLVWVIPMFKWPPSSAIYCRPITQQPILGYSQIWQDLDQMPPFKCCGIMHRSPQMHWPGMQSSTPYPIRLGSRPRKTDLLSGTHPHVPNSPLLEFHAAGVEVLIPCRRATAVTLHMFSVFASETGLCESTPLMSFPHTGSSTHVLLPTLPLV